MYSLVSWCVSYQQVLKPIGDVYKATMSVIIRDQLKKCDKAAAIIVNPVPGVQTPTLECTLSGAVAGEDTHANKEVTAERTPRPINARAPLWLVRAGMRSPPPFSASTTPPFSPVFPDNGSSFPRDDCAHVCRNVGVVHAFTLYGY